MKIIYVTTAINANDYKSFVSLWSKKPNPSNQNFHNKLIRSLAINNEVEVISIRPFSHKLVSLKSLGKEDKVEGNITWHYLPIKGNKFIRFFNVASNSLKALKKSNVKDAIILTDTINRNCLKSALKISSIYKLPVVGICTDSPSNITGTYRSYTMYLLKKAAKCDGFIALTNGLNKLFNEKDKPNVIIEGIVEDNNEIKAYESEKPYFFFGGSLLPRYGVFELIKGFKQLQRDDVSLILAGHSGNEQQVKGEIGNNPNISFVGTLDIKDILSYEKGAIANINPRPFSEDLDRFSVPSKTIEYLTSGVPTVSVRNTILKKYFDENIIWINNSNKDEIYETLKMLLNTPKEEREAFGKMAKEKVLSLYSLDQINQKLVDFLTIFSNK